MFVVQRKSQDWEKRDGGDGGYFPTLCLSHHIFDLLSNPQFVDNLHFLLSLIFLCFQKSTVVTMRET